MRGKRGNVVSGVIGGLVAALVLAAWPAAAGDGAPLVMGEKNSSKTVTRLNTRGGLRVANFKDGNPALILDVVGGTPPLQVSSTGLVANLNADLLDGLDGSDVLTEVAVVWNSHLFENVAPGEMFELHAACPEGFVVLGGGFVGPPTMQPFGSFPERETGAYWIALVGNSGDEPIGLYLESYAICAEVGWVPCETC